MGRTRSFEEGEVVAIAARTFLVSGYEATSLDALVAATGLHRGSLYTAFGSKRGLFVAALRLAGTDQLTETESMDLLLVALLETAATDRAVRDIAQQLVDGIGDHAGARLGARLLDRATIEQTPRARGIA